MVASNSEALVQTANAIEFAIIPTAVVSVKITTVVSLLLFVAAVSVTGCEPPRSKTKKPTGAPQTTATTAGTLTNPLSSALVDCEYKPPLTKGKPCGEPSGDRVPGACDPVAQTGCGDAEHCRFAVKLDETGNPSSFFRVCSDFECGSRTRLPGDECQASECMPGSLCVSGICKRYCRRDDGTGCAPDEFCVAAPLNPEFGYCEKTCDE